MAIHGVNRPLSSPFSTNSPDYSHLKSAEGGRSRNPVQQSRVNTRAVAEYYSAEKYAVEYLSKDGDKVTFSMESIQFQKAYLEIAGERNPEEIKKLIAYTKDQFQMMREKMIERILESMGGKKAGKAEKTQESNEIEVPEYWNAENTSQRIVDFATSFFDSFQGAGIDFLNTIKAAIEKGFSEARGILGAVPKSVSDLTDRTYELVMEKLDIWAVEKGILTTENGVSETVEA